MPVRRGEIQRLFILEGNVERIFTFIESTPELTDLLLTTSEKIDALYGETKCSLSILDDPESGGSQEMVVMVPTSLSADDAMSRLSKFEDDWWFEQPVELTNEVIIDIRYLK